MNLAEATGLDLVAPGLRLQVKLWITDGVALPELRQMLVRQHSVLTPFLRRHAPRECWGSRHKVAEWAHVGGEHGRTRIGQATAELRAQFTSGMVCAHEYHRTLWLIGLREGAITLFRQTRIWLRLWRLS